MPQKKYKQVTQLERIAIHALKQAGLGRHKIAAIAKRSDRTIHTVLQTPLDVPLSPAQLAHAEGNIEENLASKFKHAANIALDKSVAKIDDSTSYQQAIQSKIFLESSRLIEGKSTTNLAVASLFTDATKLINKRNKRK